MSRGKKGGRREGGGKKKKLIWGPKSGAGAKKGLKIKLPRRAERRESWKEGSGTTRERGYL